MERDRCWSGESALLVHMLCLWVKSDAHQAQFAPASLVSKPEEPGNTCTQLMDNSKRAGREMFFKTRAEIVFSFPVKVQREGRMSLQPDSTLFAQSPPEYIWCTSMALQQSHLFPAVLLCTEHWDHHQRVSVSWSPGMFLTRCRYYSCHHALHRFSHWLDFTTVQTVQCD